MTLGNPSYPIRFTPPGRKSARLEASDSRTMQIFMQHYIETLLMRTKCQEDVIQTDVMGALTEVLQEVGRLRRWAGVPVDGMGAEGMPELSSKDGQPGGRNNDDSFNSVTSFDSKSLQEIQQPQAKQQSELKLGQKLSGNSGSNSTYECGQVSDWEKKHDRNQERSAGVQRSHESHC